MADSSARSLNLEPKKRIDNNTSTPKKIVLDPKHVPYTRFEKIIVSIGASITLVLIMFMVSVSVSQTSAQHQLANTQQEVAKEQNQNTNLRQEIGQLTSSARMTRIAKQQGLTLQDNNIRTIR